MTTPEQSPPFGHRESEEARPIRNNPHFKVIDEGDGYIVVDKPAPLLVHPSTPGNPPTLQDGLQGLLAFEIANGGQISIINRLDRETSGVVLIATHKETARAFSMAMQDRKVQKRYLALVHGHPDVESFVVDEPILRMGEVKESPIWVRQCVHPEGATSRTEFRVLQRADGSHGPLSLIEARPITGRMHQIRVHLNHAGLPMVGDKIYGVDSNCYLDFIETGWTEELAQKLILPRQALHCDQMGILIDGEMSLWEAETPEEIRGLLGS